MIKPNELINVIAKVMIAVGVAYLAWVGCGVVPW
jgi:hypothetical protein